MGALTNLETLDLSFCEGLDQLPDGLGALTKLQTLNLSWCKGLTQLPDEMGTLTGLTSLLVLLVLVFLYQNEPSKPGRNSFGFCTN